MKEACFEYFKRGGACAAGPVRLLAGLAPSNSTLYAHFFSVALYGCRRLLFPFPTPTNVALALRLLITATRIIAPLIAAEGVAPFGFAPVRNVIRYSGPYKRPEHATAAAKQ